MSDIPRTLERVETEERLDAPAAALKRRLDRVYDDRPIVPLLSGTTLGHPLHPALILAPLGAWASASILDAIPGQQRAARALVLTGLVAAVPAAAAGAVDYRTLDRRQRRVGFVHLLANVAATACYAASYRARNRGRFVSGRVWALAGLAAVGWGGVLGGHLSYAMGAGVFRFQPERRGEQPGEPAGQAPQRPTGQPAAAS